MSTNSRMSNVGMLALHQMLAINSVTWCYRFWIIQLYKSIHTMWSRLNVEWLERSSKEDMDRGETVIAPA